MTSSDYSSRTVVLHKGSILIDGATRDVLCREETLAKASLRPPPIVQLSNKLGANAISVAEMVTLLQRDLSPSRHLPAGGEDDRGSW
jgi:energy-coupling factor transport system ATP-binding protein